MAAMPDGFDLDALLAPCAGDAPVGVDLREDYSPQSLYYRIRDARVAARTAERQIDSGVAEDQDVPNPTAFWRIVRELGGQALAERSKDLEIAAWMTESLVRSDGLLGLAAGASLIAGLTGGFWDAGIFPLPDEDGMETRIAPVTGLNGQGGEGTVIQPLRMLQFCRGNDGEPVAYYMYKDAAEVAAARPADREAKYARGSLRFDELETACRAAGPKSFAGLLRRIDAARTAWADMTAIMEEKAGADGPSTSAVRDLLNDLREAAARYAPTAAEAAPDPEADIPGEQAAAGGGPAATGPARGASREDMLRDLARIAAWFRDHEPQSPLSYTLDDAIRRGRMSLPDLLAELVGDSSTRHGILGSLGIKPPPEAE